MISITHKTIVLPFEEATSDDIFADKTAYKAFIREPLHQYPELFPPRMKDGWSFHGVTKPSKQQEGLQYRRILTKTDQEVWQIRPSCMMPYLTCDTKTAEHILFLAKWAPDWA